MNHAYKDQYRMNYCEQVIFFPFYNLFEVMYLHTYSLPSSHPCESTAIGTQKSQVGWTHTSNLSSLFLKHRNSLHL